MSNLAATPTPLILLDRYDALLLRYRTVDIMRFGHLAPPPAQTITVSLKVVPGVEKS